MSEKLLNQQSQIFREHREGLLNTDASLPQYDQWTNNTQNPDQDPASRYDERCNAFIQFLALFDQERISAQYFEHLSDFDVLNELFAGRSFDYTVLKEFFDSLQAKNLVVNVDFSSGRNFAIRLPTSVFDRATLHHDSQGFEEYRSHVEIFALMLATHVRTMNEMEMPVVHRQEMQKHLKSCLFHVKKIELSNRNPFAYLEIIYWASIFMMHQAEFYEAKHLLGKALKVAARCDTPKSWRTLQIQNAMAVTRGELGQYHRSQAMLEKILEWKLEIYRADDEPVLQTMDDLSVCYMRLGSLSLAERNIKETMESKLPKYGPLDATTLHTQANLGAVYIQQSRFREACDMFEEILDKARKLIQNDNHLFIALLRHNIGTANVELGNHVKGEMQYRSALGARLSKLGADHCLTMDTVNGIANSLIHQHKLQEAEDLILGNAKVSERKHGYAHLSTLRIYEMLGILRFVQGQWKEAEKLFLEVLEGRIGLYGVNHPESIQTTQNLSWSLRMQGRYSEAETTYQRTSKINDVMGYGGSRKVYHSR